MKARTYRHVAVDCGGDGEVDAAALSHVAERQCVDRRIGRACQLWDIATRGVDPENKETRKDDEKVAEPEE